MLCSWVRPSFAYLESIAAFSEQSALRPPNFSVFARQETGNTSHKYFNGIHKDDITKTSFYNEIHNDDTQQLCQIVVKGDFFLDF